jgi:hypothetical protein
MWNTPVKRRDHMDLSLRFEISDLQTLALRSHSRQLFAPPFHLPAIDAMARDCPIQVGFRSLNPALTLMPPIRLGLHGDRGPEHQSRAQQHDHSCLAKRA